MHKGNIPSDVEEYCEFRHDIFVHKELLFYKHRVIVPESLRTEMMQVLHRSHQGVASCKDSMFWPGIMKQIEDYVLHCIICQNYSSSNPKQPMSSHDVRLALILKTSRD